MGLLVQNFRPTQASFEKALIVRIENPSQTAFHKTGLEQFLDMEGLTEEEKEFLGRQIKEYEPNPIL